MFTLSKMEPGSESKYPGGNWLTLGNFETELGAVFTGMIGESPWMVTVSGKCGIDLVVEGNPE